MGFGRTWAIALTGLDGELVRVETDVSPGLPAFVIGGLPDAACRQSAERIRAAAGNSGLAVPRSRITVNLSPAWLPKVGSGFDLPIAVAVLVAAGEIAAGPAATAAHLGELGLDGTVRPVRGVLPAVLAAAQLGAETVLVPVANAVEAALVPGVRVVPVADLGEVAAYHRARAAGLTPPLRAVPLPVPGATVAARRDLADVVGQVEARLALEVAAAGGHHLFFVGPPGAGKTMLAECLPTLLPPLSREEALEVTAVHSLVGILPPEALVDRPPYVAPHHGASMAALIGGGSGAVRPGLVSQAHRGVLFLDEAPELGWSVLQALRQPIESGEVVVARARATVRYPARFQLVLAANPCPCGQGHGKGLGCRCTPRERRGYLARLSGPLLDRVDLHVDVPAVSRVDLAGGTGDSSAVVAARVAVARERQRRRLAGTPWTVNGDVPGPRLRGGVLRLPSSVTGTLNVAVDRGTLTLRGYDRVLRVAWTLADLRGADRPSSEDIGVALSLRASAGAAA